MSKIESLSILIGQDNPSAMSIASSLSEILGGKFSVIITSSQSDLKGGDVLVALSFPRLIPAEIFEKFDLAVVAHASDLPQGRGWSPANWAAENLETSVTLSLIEMKAEIDAGGVLSKRVVDFPIWMLWPEFVEELEKAQVHALVELLTGDWRSIRRETQKGEVTYFRKRTVSDSEIDPELSLMSQWGKIRSSDPHRYPNRFNLFGKSYRVWVERLED